MFVCVCVGGGGGEDGGGGVERHNKHLVVFLSSKLFSFSPHSFQKWL